jgi:hypothetical protein
VNHHLRRNWAALVVAIVVEDQTCGRD